MFVARLGPLQFDDGPPAFAYVALRENGLMAPPEINSDAQTALAALAQQADGEPLRCEPRLRFAAEALGFVAAPTPPEVLAARAALAVTLAQQQVAPVDGAVPPELVEPTLEGYAYYMARQPFRYFSNAMPFVVKGLVKDRAISKIAVLLGNGGQEFGVGLYPDRRTFDRIMSGARPAAVTSMAFVLHEGAPFASAAIDEAYGFSGVPVVVGSGKKPNAADKLLLCAVLRAAAELTEEDPTSTGSLATPGGRAEIYLGLADG